MSDPVDIMIDLETMGTGSNAAIIAIGAVAFNIYSSISLIKDVRPFYMTVDLQSCMNFGRSVDASTIHWWLIQDESVRKEICKQGYDLQFALETFSSWLKEMALIDDIYVWGNGAAFDNVILRNAYLATKLQVPWNHWNDRCYRTMKNLFPHILIDCNSNKHHALEDAKNQAHHLMKIMRTIS